MENKVPNVESHSLRTPLGIVLAPYEACLAIAICFNEAVATPKVRQYKFLGIGSVKVSTKQRQRLLSASLLFGKFNAMAGMGLFDRYLVRHGITISRREFFGDFGPMQPASFCHDLESSSRGLESSSVLMPGFKMNKEDAARLIPAVRTALQLVGRKLDGNPGPGELPYRTEDIVKALTKDGLPKNSMLRLPGLLEYTLWTSTLVIEQSIRRGVPLLSKDLAGPAWMATDLNDSRIRLLKIAHDEISWLPSPKNLSEAFAMSNDERMLGLRSELDHLHELILSGKLKDVEDARGRLRASTEYFKGKSWATSFGGFLTYVAIPVGIADMIMGTGYIGFGVAAIGTASQFINDAIDRNKAKSWLSMGLDLKSD